MPALQRDLSAHLADSVLVGVGPSLLVSAGDGVQPSLSRHRSHTSSTDADNHDGDDSCCRRGVRK